MKVTYIFHSGFLVETTSAALLFDYYTGTIPKIRPDKPLFIFASHSHGDHFSPKIFDLSTGEKASFNPGCTSGASSISFEPKYFLSNDISRRQVPQRCYPSVTFLGPDETWQSDLLQIRTLRSNDLGVAFVIDIDGKKIFHAGDLNNWWWEGDKEDQRLAKQYHAELEKIRETHFHLAFLPLDPRIKGYYLGIEDFLDYASADMIFPMHFGERFDIIDQMLSRAKNVPAHFSCASVIARICQEGQTFTV